MSTLRPGFSLPGSIAEQPPKSGEEVVASGDVEKREDENGSFESRFNALAKERGEIDHEQAKAITLGALMRDGAQTLLKEYGSERFFQAVKDQKPGEGKITTYDIIKALEPDAKKRAALYQRTEAEVQSENQAFQAWEDNSERDQARFHSFGLPDTSFLQGAKVRLTAYQNLDGFLGKISGRSDRLFLETGYARGMHDLASLPKTEIADLRKKLEASDQDLSRVIAEIGNASDVRMEEMLKKAEVLRNELAGEIQRIASEENLKLEEWRAKVLGDLAKTGNLETATEEMKKALQKALLEVETGIMKKVEGVEKEIVKKTTPLKKLLEDTAGLQQSV